MILTWIQGHSFTIEVQHIFQGKLLSRKILNFNNNNNNDNIPNLIIVFLPNMQSYFYLNIYKTLLAFKAHSLPKLSNIKVRCIYKKKCRCSCSHTLNISIQNLFWLCLIYFIWENRYKMEIESGKTLLAFDCF